MKYFAFFLLSVVLLASCGPTRKVQRIENSISKKDTTATVIVKPQEPVIDSFSIVKHIVEGLEKQKIDFNTFSAKVKLNYEGKDEGDQATAYIRMKKDSVIWISLTGALGIEGFRLLVNKDSVKLMNKLQKTIQYRSIAYLQELTKVPFDYFSLQDVIVGNPVFVDSNIVSYKNTQNELLVLIVGNMFKNLLTLESSDLRVVHSKLDDLDSMHNRTCDITYDGYENSGDFYFSTKRRISVSEKSKLDIDLEFKNYDFNKPQDYPFSIPKNYKRR